MDEDVVEEDVYHNIMPVVDFSTYFPAATDDVFGIEYLSRFAAPTL